MILILRWGGGNYSSEAAEESPWWDLRRPGWSLTGTSVTRKVWDGKADLEEFETDSPGGGHIEGLTLRLYNPQTHEWRLFWANRKIGTMDAPQVGKFKDGRVSSTLTTRGRASRCWCDFCGRKRLRTRLTLNSRFRRMRVRPGK